MSPTDHGEECDPGCECACCKMGMEKFMQMRAELMTKYGWVADIVMDADLPNVHTHGLKENYDHPDLQAVAFIDPKIIHGVMCGIVDRIKDGDKFIAGVDYDGVIKNFKVRFVDAIENNRPVLRLILPDQHGHLDREAMTDDFDCQYEGIPE